MKKQVCYVKLSKKKQREIDQRKRGTWFGVNPVTRRLENSRAYNRKKAQGWKNDSGLAFLIAYFKSDQLLLLYSRPVSLRP